MKGYSWHQFVYRIIRLILMPYLILRFRYRFQKAERLKSPTIILANHTTDWDPMFLSASFSDHMYFVASEHMFRWGALSKLIVFLAAPIARAKATNDSRTVKQILRSLSGGANVCIFAEGNRSFNGETTEIPLSIAKLVRQSGAQLVTYRIEGGYFTQPRWGKTLRRGLVKGTPLNTYSPEFIKQQSEESLLQIIEQDLYVNAYEAQTSQPVSYKGKRLAENLETILYLCPTCKGIATIKSKDGQISCTCGLQLQYTSFGYLQSVTQVATPFQTLLDWDHWQKAELKKLVTEENPFREETPLTSDEGQSLYRIQKREAAELIGKGRLTLYVNRLTFEPNHTEDMLKAPTALVFPVEQVSAIAVHGQMDLVFSTTEGDYYEITSTMPRSATKYIELFQILSSKE